MKLREGVEHLTPLLSMVIFHPPLFDRVCESYLHHSQADEDRLVYPRHGGRRHQAEAAHEPSPVDRADLIEEHH
jgi:hypothetical protein